MVLLTRVSYPSAVEDTDTYLQPSILPEFDGRNAALSRDKAGAASRTVRAKHKRRIPTA